VADEFLNRKAALRTTLADEGQLPIEAPRVKDDPQLTRFAQRVAELCNTKFGDGAAIDQRAVTYGDLFKAGVVDLRGADGRFRTPSGPSLRDVRWRTVASGDGDGGGGGQVTAGPPGPPGPPWEPPVYPPPTVPTNLAATGALTSIIPTWDAQDFDVVAYVEVWAAGSNNLAAASKIGNAYTNIYVDAVGATGVQKWYWIRSVGFNPEDPPSAYNAGSGVSAQTGKIGNTDLADLIVTAGKLADGAVGSNQLAAGAVSAAKFAATLEPVVVLSALPNPVGYTGPKLVFLTTDQKLYRYTGSAWTAAIPTSDLSGLITTTQITDGAISTPKLAANSVTANELAANSVTAGKIVAGAVNANAIAANAIAVGTAAIQNGAIVNAMIGAAAIDDAKIANVDAGKITTGFLNAGRIQTGSIDSRIATIVDAQIQSLSAGKIVASYLSAINSNLGTVTAGTIDLNYGATAGSWSYIRSAGKWLDSNNGFIVGGYQADGSYFFDVKAGNNQIRMNAGPQTGGSNAFINFGNGIFSVDPSGNLTATSAYIRGNVEATSINVNSANVVSTLNLQDQAIIIPRSFENPVVLYGNSNFQDMIGGDIYLPDSFTKMFITFSCSMWCQNLDVSTYPILWGFRLLRSDGTPIWYTGPLYYPGGLGGPNETVQQTITFARNWAENGPGTFSYGVQFYGYSQNIVAAYPYFQINATRKS